LSTTDHGEFKTRSEVQLYNITHKHATKPVSKVSGTEHVPGIALSLLTNCQ